MLSFTGISDVPLSPPALISRMSRHQGKFPRSTFQRFVWRCKHGMSHFELGAEENTERHAPGTFLDN